MTVQMKVVEQYFHVAMVLVHFLYFRTNLFNVDYFGLKYHYRETKAIIVSDHKAMSLSFLSFKLFSK